MPEVSKESAQEVIAKERKFSPSQSESEHETAPRDRRADVAEDGGEHTSAVSGTWPYPPEVASKLEKLKRLRRIPIGKEPRILDLVAKFSDFPWAPPCLSLLFLFLVLLAFAISTGTPFLVPTEPLSLVLQVYDPLSHAKYPIHPNWSPHFSNSLPSS